jgi:hypothetical protein
VALKNRSTAKLSQKTKLKPLKSHDKPPVMIQTPTYQDNQQSNDDQDTRFMDQKNYAHNFNVSFAKRPFSIAQQLHQLLGTCKILVNVAQDRIVTAKASSFKAKLQQKSHLQSRLHVESEILEGFKSEDYNHNEFNLD